MLELIILNPIITYFMIAFTWGVANRLTRVL